jgi:hypothetical protein
MAVVVNSVLANSISTVSGIRLSVLEAIVVMTLSSVRRIEEPLIEYTTTLGDDVDVGR